MDEKLPTSMFCGFPVKVATLPTFAAVTSATRYGTGRDRHRRAEHRDARAIEPEARDANECEPDVARDEGRDRDRPAHLAHGHGSKHTCAPESALLESRSAKR